jgi:hypothetical protein
MGAAWRPTYHSPKGRLFASVGDQVDSSTVGQVTTSHWVAAEPIRNASFNLGFFKDYQVQEEGIPPVTVLVAEGAHRHLGGLRQKNMKETVGADVAKSLRFFQYAYGPAPAKRMYATEIPYSHGEAFRPGPSLLVDLSANRSTGRRRSLSGPRGRPSVVGNRSGFQQLPRPD